MRELVLKMSITVDGFVSGPNGEVSWIFDGDADAIAWVVATISDASLHIMGSRTFEDMAAFWPTSTAPFAAPMNRIPKAVFTRKGPGFRAATETTTALDNARAEARPGEGAIRQPGAESWDEAMVASGDLADDISRLKSEEGRPIVAHGGASFARSLIAAGVVDRYALLVHPVALGRGQPIFDGLAEPKRLRLERSIAFPRGAVAKIYRPA